ncbi:AAA family ATPase [Geobacter sp.]|uniref:ATP-dependent nuclease n=1 Tax=Geobacter sp. TaxID=46610 RepID=UPI00262BCD13|nr:AAA family ATPase [Geobacter sp.]
MLTRISIRNFKGLEDVDFELGKSVVLIGPNNSGKTTALQALALWDIGHRLWSAKRGGKSQAEKRPGVTINRRDLIAIPVPIANLLWHDLHVRKGERRDGKTVTQNVLIEITVEGVTNGAPWVCGLEFDYANEESFYCRPLRIGEGAERLSIPEVIADKRVAFLPPMSGLSASEPKLEPGRINVLIGEGQTAQVLRNLCYQIYDSPQPNQAWSALKAHMSSLFGITLLDPVYVKERGEITMAYRERSGVELDLSSSGRGVQQTLLLLAHLYAHPGTILLLDEPDAHLEILRQRQIYQLITEIAEQQGSQIIAASHSEVVLNEAADRDIVISFVGRPKRMDDRGSQVYKALKEIGFEHYYQADETGWVLYLEGSTDLSILKVLASRSNHEAARYLERPFVHYVGNQVGKVRDHFWGLRYAKPDLVGIALFDRLERELPEDLGVTGLQWRRRELENYICFEDVLMAYATYELADDLFGAAEAEHRESLMRETINEIAGALRILGKDPWSPDIKATDEFLDRLFERYFKKLGLPNMLRKSDYHVLAHLVPVDKIDPEIMEKLDAIVEVARKAKL